MNRHSSVAAFMLGLAAVIWVGFATLQTSPLALTMTALIGTVYWMGGLELRRFHQATVGLNAALAAVPDPLPSLGNWLSRVPPSLQNAVRLRIEGERIALPGPVLTPYLVGLLVLLGMLGTFLGMVVTLNGAVMALETTTDLPTIRAALAAPVKGLGLAFGTSVAGVAASAMLGLVSALCRRERLQAAQLLDTRIATTLRAFTLAQQRQETLDALRTQSLAMPAMADRMEALMALMERQGQALNERLLAGQDNFHRHAQTAYTDLAAAVGTSLKESLSESARAAGATIQPLVEATMTGITTQAGLAHARTADTVRLQLDGLSERFDAAVTAVAQTWRDALVHHQHTSENLSGGLRQSLAGLLGSFEQQSASLLATVERSQAALQAESAARDQQRLAAWTQSLQSMAAALQQEWQQAGTHTLAQQQQVCRTLEQTASDMHAQAQAQASSTIAEIARLVATAAEAPRAAAEVVGLMREKLSDSMARDNQLLEERSRIMATLGTLLDAVNRAATEQRGAVEALVASSASMLEHTGTQFTEKIDAEAARLGAAASQITGSAIEMSSLGEAFGAAVQQFGDSNSALIAQLQRIEGALGKSSARSDEQLAYYVAQARELIDLSISSQRQVVDDMHRLSGKLALPEGEVR